MITASIDVAAPARIVYDLVSDVPNMPRWAAETYRCEWVDGADAPVVGARFQGRNQNGRSKWATVCEVTDAEPGRRFAFRVRVFGMDVADWAYEIKPVEGGGCRVTETNVILANWLIRKVIAPSATGVKDRATHNQRNMELTLSRLKKAAEERATAQP